MAAGSSPSGCSAKRRNAASRLSAAGTSCSRRSGNDCGSRQGRHEGGKQVDWHRGYFAVRQPGIQPRRRAHRPGGFTPAAARSRSGRRATTAISTTGVELGTRNLKMALRRLRRFAREGAPEELDLDGTIDSTARNAGILDIRLQPERRNAVKLLLLLDVGGSMDPHVKICEELFSAARAEFKHLEYFYFHNFPYERLWKDNRAALQRDHRHPGAAAHFQCRLPRGVRRRCDHESLRNRAAGWQRRTLERRAGPRLDAADCGALSAPGVAQSRARGPLEMDSVHLRSRAKSSATACSR